jgi:hypothetical protein
MPAATRARSHRREDLEWQFLKQVHNMMCLAMLIAANDVDDISRSL